MRRIAPPLKMENSTSTETSFPKRLKLWFEKIPFATRFVFVLCTSLYLTELLLGWDPTFSVCLHVPSVVDNLQIYRIFTFALFHVGILHLTFNMLAFIPIGLDLERRIGTVKFLYLIFLIIFLSGILQILLAALLASTNVMNLNSCGVGFSGVVFGLIVIYAQVASIEQFSVFGMIPVPAKIYPWALLIIWQLLIPTLSFIGHLSGILVGQMKLWGWIKLFEINDGIVGFLERSIFASCQQSSSFVLNSEVLSDSLPTHSGPRSEEGERWSFSGWYRRLSGFGSTDEGSPRDERFPGEAKYLSEESRQQSTAAIPVITETQDPNGDFNRLLEMGFDAPSVRAALLTSDGDFTTAMNKLTGAS